MNLLGIVAVSGKPGLWRALTQNKTGYILESLDAQKTKMVANISTAKIAALADITLFGLEDDIKLVDVFGRMKEAASVPDAKADGKVLRAFFREVAPDHDEEKVYASDMKKIISWYYILKEFPLFNEEDPTSAAAAHKAAGADETAAAAPETAVEPETKAEETSAPKEKPVKKATKPASAGDQPEKPKAAKAAAKKA